MYKTLWAVKDLMKVVAIRGARVATRCLYVLPIKENRVIFYSFYGKQYSCNPKAISDYLLAHYGGDYEVIWAFVDPKKFEGMLPEGVRAVNYHSLQRFVLQATSRICINNCGTYSWFPARKGQVHMNTWHAGGAYKRLLSDRFADYNRSLMSRETTHMVSSCRLFTKYNIKELMGFAGTILEVGMPRNDVFFDATEMARRNKAVRDLYGIDDEALVVLFAPTWRYDGKVPFPDFVAVGDALRARFGRDVHLLVRNHHYSQKRAPGVSDASDYYDMQDLLCAADVLITDYSSSIWDYSLTRRPCFLYMEDYDEYDSVQGFFTEPSSWGFPICKSTDELVEAIASFDEEDHVAKMAEHQERFGSFESGHAAHDVCEALFGREA